MIEIKVTLKLISEDENIDELIHLLSKEFMLPSQILIKNQNRVLSNGKLQSFKNLNSQVKFYLKHNKTSINEALKFIIKTLYKSKPIFKLIKQKHQLTICLHLHCTADLGYLKPIYLKNEDSKKLSELGVDLNLDLIHKVDRDIDSSS